jgi:hypothetical protein
MATRTVYAAEYSSTLEIKESSISGSEIGDGVFAKTAFSSGDTIMTSLGAATPTITGHKAVEVHSDDSKYTTILVDRFDSAVTKYFIPTNEFRYLNHSTTPNVKVLNNKKLYAIADIEVGDELLLDYGDIGYYN